MHGGKKTGQKGQGVRGRIAEAPIAIVLQEHIDLQALYRIGPIAAADQKEIDVAVAVVVGPDRAGTEPIRTGVAHAGRRRHVLEAVAAVVAIEGIGTDVGQIEIQVAVVVIIRPGTLLTYFHIGHTERTKDFGDGAAVVAQQGVFLLAVDEEQIQVAVVVIVHPVDVVGVAFVVENRRLNDAGKGGIAGVVQVEFVFEVISPQIDIQITVVVVIPPGHRGFAAALLGIDAQGIAAHFCKNAGLVFQQVVLVIKIRHIEIQIAVVVVVCPGRGRAIAPIGQKMLLAQVSRIRHIGKIALALVAPQGIDRQGLELSTPVGDVDIEIPVAVVVAPGQIGAAH